MSKVHRAVMSRIAGPVRAVFLDTPAGFELNADQISAKAVKYFKRRFDLDLQVASFKVAATAAPADIESALSQLQRANYIFAGPGSPTYAVRNWRDTVIFEALKRRLANGVHLVLASAAAIAIGRYALPVYEIFKVGEAPHWVQGLDLLGPYGLELAIVPHWNNAEGGTYDTRYCFMGEPRLKLLEQRLPDSTTIVGIEEYTACVLDLGRGEGQVIGAGRVIVRRGGRETGYHAGTVFKLDQLKGEGSGGETGPQPKVETEEPCYYLPPDWDTQPEAVDEGNDLIELLVTVRAQLRAAKQWVLADEIRERLSALGIILEDGPEGTTWRKG
jgi:peptidase E